MLEDMNRLAATPRVAVVRGTDRRENIRQAQLLLGEPYVRFLKTARRLFLHPNLVSDRNQLASTHVEAVRAILDVISLQRADEVLIGDASYHNTRKAFERFGYEGLRRSGNIRLLDLNEDATVESWAYDRELKKQPIPASRTVLESDGIILVVPAKMHSYYAVTLSLKTHVVGSMVVPRSPFGIHARWPRVHSGYAAAHRTLADWFVEHPARAAFIDGREAMEGNGPTSGTKVELDWAVGSLDAVAADAVAAWLMGFDPAADIGYLAFLREKGYTVDPAAMEIVGEKHWQGLRRDLVRPETWPEISGWRTEPSVSS